MDFLLSSGDDDDEAPEAVSFGASASLFQEQVAVERKGKVQARKRQKEQKQKWKAKTTGSKRKASELDADDVEADEKHTESSTSPKKKRKGKKSSIKWVDASDVFLYDRDNHKKKKKHSPSHRIDDSAKAKSKSKLSDSATVGDFLESVKDEEDNSADNECEPVSSKKEEAVDETDAFDLFDEMPAEVLTQFEAALNKSETEAELKSAWQKILEKHSGRTLDGAKRKVGARGGRRKHAFDRVFVDGFELQISGVFRRKEQYRESLSRALAMRKRMFKRHTRVDRSRQLSLGRKGPALLFKRGSQKSGSAPASFWGQRLAFAQDVSEKKSELTPWLTSW